MKYRIEFVFSKDIKIDDLRNIKLQLISDEVEITLISDYPIFIPDDKIYLGNTQFNITTKEVKICKDYHTIIVKIVDSNTLITIEKEKNRIEQEHWRQMLKMRI